MLDSHFHGNDTLSVWMQSSVKFLIWTKVISEETSRDLRDFLTFSEILQAPQKLKLSFFPLPEDVLFEAFPLCIEGEGAAGGLHTL